MRLFGARSNWPDSRGHRRENIGIFIDALGGPTLFRSEYQFATGAIVKAPGTIGTQPGPKPGIAANETWALYFGGGFDAGPFYLTAYEHCFETRSFSIVAGGPGTGRQSLGGAANNTCAMFVGGYVLDVPQTIRDLYTFSTKSSVQLSTGLTTAIARMSATSDTTTALFAGGNDATTGIRRTSRYVFATDALTEVSNGLTVARGNHAPAISNGTLAAILWGFDSPTWLSTVDEYTFATDTCAQHSLGTTRESTGHASAATDKTIGVVMSYGTDLYNIATRAVTQPLGNGINPSGYGMGGASNCHGGLA